MPNIFSDDKRPHFTRRRANSIRTTEWKLEDFV